MKRPIAQVAKVIAGLILLAPPAQAAVTFTAGGGNVSQGSQINVPVTVSGFSGIGVMQFDLTFDSSLLQYQPPPANFGIPYLGPGNFGATQGIITVSWDNEDISTYPNGISVADGTILFTVQFLANAGLGTSLIGFSNFEVVDYTLQNFIAASGVAGNVNVVPEPINIALGIFAGLFAGGTTLRWFLRKRSVRSAACS